MTMVTVSITLAVTNERQLRRAVRDHLVECNIDEAEADSFLDGDLVPLAEVARLAVDQGDNVEGCDIHDSWASVDAPAAPQGIVAQLLEGTDTPGAYIEACRMRLGGKSLNVSQNSEFPGPAVWIGWLNSSIKGAGATLMQRLCANADRQGVLLVAALDDNGSGKLAGWYTQFGFIQDPCGGEIIERLPRVMVNA